MQPVSSSKPFAVSATDSESRLSLQPRRLLWHIFPPIILIVILSLAAISSFASRTMRDLHLENMTGVLAARGELVKYTLENRIRAGRSPASIDETVKRLGRLSDTRISVIEPDGTVTADSAKNPAVMTDHSDRPEIMRAMRGETATAIRYSDTLKKDLIYVAAPMRNSEGDVIAVIRTARPLTALSSALEALNRQLLIGGFAVAAVAAIVSLLLARRVTRPIEELQHAATRYAAGDLSVRLPATGSAETAGLARSLNIMAAQLDDRIRDVVEQRNERDAVLAGMVEAVIAVDSNERISTMNNAAGRILGVDPVDSLGRTIHEIARNAELLAFVSSALRSEEVLERDLDLHGDRQRSLQAHGAALRDAHGKRIGAVVVLNDVTRLRRLEAIRREFVANVSHELKTPITSIKGFIETLSDGAINDPEASERFLQIASRQADRLGAIIEDLLSLSRIEQESEHGTLPLHRDRLHPVLDGALEICRHRADAKQVTLLLECDPELECDLNAPLIEQALVNLIDNAVKYTGDGKHVTISANDEGGTLCIEVADNGNGIAAQHLPRLFERFYRVDKARSRGLGGTGLGLAIVKHIAQAHGGNVAVQSEVGEGTRFSLRLPFTRGESV